MTNLTASTYLIVSSRGRIRFTKNPPVLQANEVMIKLGVVLPYALFERPLINARVVVDPEAVRPTEITPEILINTAALIEQQTGFKVELTVAAPDLDEETMRSSPQFQLAIRTIREVIREFADTAGLDMQSLINICGGRGIPAGVVQDVAERMHQAGEIYFPKAGWCKLAQEDPPQ